MLNKYLKCSVWRLALRYDIYIYIYIYMSLGFKRLKSLKLSVLHKITHGEKASEEETDMTYCRVGHGGGEKHIFSLTI